MAALTPYFVTGNLPFEGGGAGLFNAMNAEDGVAGLAAHYEQAYQKSLDFQRALYGNVQAGFKQLSGAQATDQAATLGSYHKLLKNVLGEVKGFGKTAARDIANAAGIARGKTTNALINQGISNLTVANAFEKGISKEEREERTALAERMANLRANYKTSIGGAAQSYRERAEAARMALGQNQLKFLEGVSGGYPDAGMYAQLANTVRALTQAGMDREEAMRVAGSMGGQVPASPGRGSGGPPGPRMGLSSGGGPQTEWILGGGGGGFVPKSGWASAAGGSVSAFAPAKGDWSWASTGSGWSPAAAAVGGGAAGFMGGGGGGYPRGIFGGGNPASGGDGSGYYPRGEFLGGESPQYSFEPNSIMNYPRAGADYTAAAPQAQADYSNYYASYYDPLW